MHSSKIVYYLVLIWVPIHKSFWWLTLYSWSNYVSTTSLWFLIVWTLFFFLLSFLSFLSYCFWFFFVSLSSRHWFFFWWMMMITKYSLLQTVVETCQKKKRCKINSRPHHSQSYGQMVTGGTGHHRTMMEKNGFNSSSSTSTGVDNDNATTTTTNNNNLNNNNKNNQNFNNNPCPERTRLVEVAYKCRPCKY